ncbi:MAG: hypothetical protein AAF226_18065, partial [Verrucomicrobiota bacterium]
EVTESCPGGEGRSLVTKQTKQQAQQTADNVTLPTPSKPARPAGGLFSGFKKKNAGSASPVNPYANPQ